MGGRSFNNESKEKVYLLTKIRAYNTSNAGIILLQLGFHEELVKTRSIVAGHSSLCI